MIGQSLCTSERIDTIWGLLIAFFMDLFARDYYIETYKTVKRYLLEKRNSSLLACNVPLFETGNEP